MYGEGLVLLTIAHYIVGTDRSPQDLGTVALFGLWLLAPYVGYLFAVYWLSTRMTGHAAIRERDGQIEVRMERLT